MRLSKPRIPPLEADQWDDPATELMTPLVESGHDYNIFKTLANHPKLARRWMVFANHILGKSTLPERERELVILRIGNLCRAGYELAQHESNSRYLGMSEEEINSARTGPETAGLSELDRLLLQATDELHADAHISDATWQGLSAHYSTQQMMDLVFTIGQYNLVSMALNSFGVQLEAGLGEGA